MTPAQLGPAQRSAALRRMATETYDVVVVGGGVVGAGAALDAASRGLSVALLEMRDYAAGTSSRSSKLIHGGLRYLESLQLGLVGEALRERRLLLTQLAPHLVRPVPFLYPLSHRGWERPYVGAGMLLYDLLGGRRALPRHSHLTRRGALRLAPGLRRDALVGAVRYFDAEVDDARHTVTVARTAAAFGADLANRVQARGFLREAGRVVGVRAIDLESGAGLAVRARQVVNATGVWTDELQQQAGRGRFNVRASKGVHLVVPKDRFQSDAGLILRTERSVLFVIPWGRHWIVGTTDTDWQLDKAHPAASRHDIAYLLERVNRVLAAPLTADDIVGVYAGLRPLLAGEADDTSRLSREHAVAQPVPGLVVVAGGKYTTYRVMARDAVDAAARNLERRVPPSVTHLTPLVGAGGFAATWNARHRIAAQSGLHVARVEHLLRRYGSAIDELLELISRGPSLGEPLDGASDYLAAEIVHAASHEGALHLDDVLTRRTRVSIETFDRGLAAAEPAARLMGDALGWSEEEIRREVDGYAARVQAERDSQEQPDDTTASAARLGARDVAPMPPLDAVA
jgi:glycerol-3-phosphate dehydrogenase